MTTFSNKFRDKLTKDQLLKTVFKLFKDLAIHTIKDVEYNRNSENQLTSIRFRCCAFDLMYLYQLEGACSNGRIHVCNYGYEKWEAVESYNYYEIGLI